MKKLLAGLAPAILLAAPAFAQTHTTIMNTVPVSSGGSAIYLTSKMFITPNIPDASWILGSANITPHVVARTGDSGTWDRLYLGRNVTLGYPLWSSGDYIRPRTLRVGSNANSWSSAGNWRIGFGFWPSMTPQCRADPTEDFTGFVITQSSGNRLVQLYENGVAKNNATYPASNAVFDLEIDTETGAFILATLNGQDLTANFPSVAFSNSATRVVGIFDRNGDAGDNRSVLIYQNGFTVASDTLFLGSVFDADALTAESATLHARVLAIPDAATGVADARICYGREDAGETFSGWEVVTNVTHLIASVGDSFTLPIEGLAIATNYFARLFIQDDLGNTGFSAAKQFDTVGAPELGAVTHAVTPAIASFTVNIEKPGYTPVLNFYWGYSENSMALAASTNEFGAAHVFEVAGLAHGAECHYAVELVSPFGVSAFTNSFPVLYNFQWGLPGGGNWGVPGNWNPNGVPDFAGDSATIIGNGPSGGDSTSTINLDGTGGITLGRLTITPSYYRHYNVGSTDGSKIIMDNNGDAAQITGNVQVNTYARISAPIHFNGPATVSSTGSNDTHFQLEGDITGPGPVTVTGAITCFGVPAGVTRVITTPVSTSGGGGRIGKRGAGTLVFEGGTNTWNFPGRYDNYPGVAGGGGALVLSNNRLECSSSNTQFDGGFFLFDGGNNTLVITNGAALVFNNNATTRYNYFNAAGNTVIVTGPGSEFLMPGLTINQTQPALRVEDGGYARLHHGNISCNGANGLIWVGSANPGHTSTLDLYTTTRTLAVNGAGSRLTAASGGVITNGVITIGGGADNQLALDGGKVFCSTLNVLTNNCLAPVLSPALRGATDFPVKVTTATFDLGAKITPVYDTPVFGVFKLVEAGNEIAVENITIDAPKNLTWKLVHDENKKQLSLLCAPAGTLFLLK